MFRRYRAGPLGGMASAAIFAAIALSSPAEAVIISSGDVGTTFTVDFDGNIAEGPVSGLTGTAAFEFLGIEANSYKIGVNLTNTSSTPITASRISVLAFDLAPMPTGGSASGDFDVFVKGPENFPNNQPDVDVCVKGGGGPNCSGGGSDGASLGNSIAFTIFLTYSLPLPTQITLSGFQVRYQSIAGSSRGNSGTGSGTERPPSVPEPSPLALLGVGLLALGALARRRHEKAGLPALVATA